MTGLRAVPVDEIRKTIKKTNAKEMTDETVIMVAKELGYDLAEPKTKAKKTLIKSLRMKMRYAMQKDE